MLSNSFLDSSKKVVSEFLRLRAKTKNHGLPGRSIDYSLEYLVSIGIIICLQSFNFLYPIVSFHSDGELRVLATRLMPSPLTTQDFNAFLLSIANCSHHSFSNNQSSDSRATHGSTDDYNRDVREDYLEAPQFSRTAYRSCPFWREPLLNYVKELKRTKWPFQVDNL